MTPLSLRAWLDDIRIHSHVAFMIQLRTNVDLNVSLTPLICPRFLFCVVSSLATPSTNGVRFVDAVRGKVNHEGFSMKSPTPNI